jgi:hypothetical protein
MGEEGEKENGGEWIQVNVTMYPTQHNNKNKFLVELFC